MDDMRAMRMLHELGMHSVGAAGLEPVLREICDVAIALSDADFGNVQLIDPATADLRIVAHRGFPSWWIDFWNDAARGLGVCGSSVAAGARIIVEDVTSSPLFASKQLLDVQLEAGVRAVQSTPLLTRSGKAVGVFSTHFRRPHRLSERVLRWLDMLARQAADLIENAQVTDALRRSEARFRALVTATAEVIYTMSPDWSQMRYLEGRGFIPDTPEVSDDCLTRYIDPDDQPRVWEAIQHAIRTKTVFDLVHRVRRVNGSLGWTHSRAVPLFDAEGRILEWFGAASDVTASKQAAAELFEEQLRLRALLESLPVGVAFTDTPTCERVMGNRALLEQFDAHAEDNVSASAPDTEAHGRQVVYLRDGKPLGASELPLQRAAREGRTIPPTELHVRLPSGKQFCIEASGAPIRNAEGQVIGAVSVTVDITERKRAVAAREQARLKDEFLAVLGHELRNPLAAISTAIDLLKSEGRRSKAAAASRPAVDELIRSQVAVLRRLVDDLLDISRLSLGNLRLSKESVSLTALLETAAAAARPIALERSQDLQVHLPPVDVRFWGDRVRLQEIVANLLDNASKYSGAGGRIELSGTLEGQDVVIRCKGSGPGVAHEDQDKIFEPLVRLDSARLDAPGGLGLGLALVRRLAVLHGGSATVHSEGLGAGSEFVVRIPFECPGADAVPVPQPRSVVAAARASEGAPDRGLALAPAPARQTGVLHLAGPSSIDGAPVLVAPARRHARPLRTLLVEDHPELGAATLDLLRGEGLEVIYVASGREALDAAAGVKPRILLCDMGLPDMEGLAVVDTLRPQLASWGTYVAMVTARTAGELRPYNKRARELGVDEFITKPITIHWVRNLIARLPAG